MERYNCCCFFFFFFKQKTAYEISSRDWSSDVCSSDLVDELAEVCVEGGDAALLVILAVLRWIEVRRHRAPEAREILDVLVVGGAELRHGQRPEHPAEVALEERRPLGRHQSTWRHSMSGTHRRPLLSRLVFDDSDSMTDRYLRAHDRGCQCWGCPHQMRV